MDKQILKNAAIILRNEREVYREMTDEQIEESICTVYGGSREEAMIEALINIYYKISR